MGKTNLDKVASLQESIKKGGGGGSKVPIYELQEGLNRFRILPPPEGMDVPWIEAQNCFKVGPSEKTIVLRRPFGLEPDPVSDYIDDLAKSKDKASQEELEKIAPKRRFKMFVLDRNAESAGAILFDTNIMVMKQILKFFMDPEYGDLADPDEGHDIKIMYTPKEKTKGKRFPEWEVTPSPKTTPLRSKALSDEEYEELVGTNYFEEYRIGYPSTAEYMQAVLDGSDEGFEGSRVTRPDGSELPAYRAEEETKPTPKSQPKKAKIQLESEEDEEEQEPDTDDSDESQALADEDNDEAVQAALAATKKQPAKGMSVADQIKAKLAGKAKK